jgi:hypothetical protein
VNDSTAFTAYAAMERTMKHRRKWARNAGLTVHAVVGGVMLLFGWLMIASAWARLGCSPLPAGVEALVQFEISDYLLPRPDVAEVAVQMEVCLALMILGVGQIAIGLLLITRSTSLPGAILASTFWGGAVCLSMTRKESYLLPFVMLVLSWIGAYLRHPAMLGCFSGCQKKTEASSIAVQAGQVSSI